MKPKQSHTPGPWNVGWNNRPYLIWSKDGTDPVFLAETQNHVDKADALANARLMASAPELLSSLKTLVAKYGYNPNGTKKDWSEYVDARAAIAKAEGKIK